MKRVTKIVGLSLALILMGCSQIEVQMPKSHTIIENNNPILSNLNGMLKIFHEKPLTVIIADLENETGVPTLPAIINTIAKKSFNDIGSIVSSSLELCKNV
jgi:hypothetical protein